MDTAHMVDCVKRYIHANGNHDIAVIEQQYSVKVNSTYLLWSAQQCFHIGLWLYRLL